MLADLPRPLRGHLYNAFTHSASVSWQDGSMKTLRFFFLFVATTTTALACGDYTLLNNPRALAHLALSMDQSEGQKAIRKLRALGPAGLQALLEAHAGLLTNTSQIDLKLRGALDAVSGQR